MCFDITAAAASGIGVQSMCHAVDETHWQAAARRPCECILILSGETDECRQIRRRPVIFDEAFREADIAIDEHPADGPPVVQHENGLYLPNRPIFECSAAGKSHAQASALDIVQQPVDEPCAHAGATLEARVLCR